MSSVAVTAQQETVLTSESMALTSKIRQQSTRHQFEREATPTVTNDLKLQLKTVTSESESKADEGVDSDLTDCQQPWGMLHFF